MPDYGSLTEVKSRLQPTDDAVWTAADDATLTSIRHAVSLAIEEDTGRTFGASVPDTTIVVYAGGAPVIIFPIPARSITAVTVGGTITGGTVEDGLPLVASQWAYYPVDQKGRILGLRLVSGGWWGVNSLAGAPLTPVEIVGDFSDTDDDDVVPDDITEIANFLVAETYKYQNASPAGFIGPDGSTVPIRDPWKDPLVVRVLARWRVRTLVAGF